MLQNAVYCEQIQIDDFEKTASAFLRDILGIKPHECFLSDESDLDDFSLMGDSLDTGELSWDKYVIAKIQTQYGITLTTTRVNLVSLFDRIEQSSKVMLH
jgi:hypothetical protein